MTMTPRLSRLLGLACLAAMVGGCSAGAPRWQGAASSSSASGQVASALFVQQWGQILWGLVTSQTGTQTPTFGDPIFNPDGSVSQSFTSADGTTGIITVFPDGSARLDIVWPEGGTQTVLQSVPEFDGVSKTTIQWQITSSDGLSVEYTSIVDDRGTPFDMTDDITELQGLSLLPRGLTQQFEVATTGGQTEVQANQSDGSAFTLTAPLAPPVLAYPDFPQPTAGTYSSPGFDIQFVLASTGGDPSRWASMSSDLGGGVTGEFSLNADFSGSGQLTQSGELLALLSWTRTGETDVRYLTAESSDASPAGAAVDYLTHRWQTLTALLAPAPGPIMAGGDAGQWNPYRTGISLPR
jgi:hypothetical protein